MKSCPMRVSSSVAERPLEKNLEGPGFSSVVMREPEGYHRFSREAEGKSYAAEGEVIKA